MKKKRGAGQEAMFLQGMGQLRAKITPKFRTISEIKAERSRITDTADFTEQKDELQNLIEKKIQDIEINEINSKLKNEKVDVTLPERSFNRGKIHPVSQVIDEISSIFSEIGFSVE